MVKGVLLCLIRHGESTWNHQNIFTGCTDVPLSKQGKKDTVKAATKISELKFDIAFTSILKRAGKSLEIILETNNWNIPVIKIDLLNERHYGTLQGKNKDEVIKLYGEEQVRKWRRSYDEKPPEGESLKDCQKRIIPYLENSIMNYLRDGKNVLMVGHGNSLRAIIMHLEKMTPEEIIKFDLELTTPHLYHYNRNLELLKKEVRSINGAHNSVL